MPASPGRRLDGGRPVSAQGWGEGTPVPPEPCECFPGGGPGAVPLAGASAVSACFWKSQCRPIGRFLRAVAGQGALCLRRAGEIANAAISWLLVGRSFTGAHAALVVRDKINDDIVRDLVHPKSPLEKDRGSCVRGRGGQVRRARWPPARPPVRLAPGRLPGGSRASCPSRPRATRRLALGLNNTSDSRNRRRETKPDRRRVCRTLDAQTGRLWE